MKLSEKVEVPSDFAERYPRWVIRDGVPCWKTGQGKSVSYGVWIKCDREACGKIAPAHKLSAKKYCSTVCAYKERYGAKHHNWKGGRHLSKNGYVRVAVGDGRREFEHRIVMERKLRRKLEPWEHIHHRNGIKTDNRESNLEIWLVNQHKAGSRIEDLIVDILNQPEVKQLKPTARQNVETAIRRIMKR